MPTSTQPVPEIKYEITKDQRGWWIRCWEGESIHPVIFKATPKEAISRLMQMMDVDEAKKQDYPEQIGLGIHDDNNFGQQKTTE